MRKLVLSRFLNSGLGVFGRLRVVDGIDGDVFSCFTVERPWVDNTPRISCVLAGIYKLVLEMSARFHRLLWELKNVPHRDEAKIHSANFPFELEGCIGVGRELMFDAKRGYAVTHSRETLDALHGALVGLTETTIEIEDHYAEDISH